jgi:biotin carboxyl carrier protein
VKNDPVVTRIGDGMYRVEINGRAEIVYVAGSSDNRWAFWNGAVFQAGAGAPTELPRGRRQDALEALSAPMPASVLKVAVAVGARVKRGDTLVILEAMKMELPLRASHDATVKAVRCREGERVQSGAVLVELE